MLILLSFLWFHQICLARRRSLFDLFVLTNELLSFKDLLKMQTQVRNGHRGRRTQPHFLSSLLISKKLYLLLSLSLGGNELKEDVNPRIELNRQILASTSLFSLEASYFKSKYISLGIWVKAIYLLESPAVKSLGERERAYLLSHLNATLLPFKSQLCVWESSLKCGFTRMHSPFTTDKTRLPLIYSCSI